MRSSIDSCAGVLTFSEKLRSRGGLFLIRSSRLLRACLGDRSMSGTREPTRLRGCIMPVAHPHDAIADDAFAPEIGQPQRGGDVQKSGQQVGDPPVALLGHGVVEASQSRLDVNQLAGCATPRRRSRRERDRGAGRYGAAWCRSTGVSAGCAGWGDLHETRAAPTTQTMRICLVAKDPLSSWSVTFDCEHSRTFRSRESEEGVWSATRPPRRGLPIGSAVPSAPLAVDTKPGRGAPIARGGGAESASRGLCRGARLPIMGIVPVVLFP